VTIEPFAREHLDAVFGLFAQERWLSYSTDPERTYAALTAAGVTSLVALDGGEVVGAIQLQSDGVIQAHISAMVVARDHRERGIGRRLIREALERAGGERIDLCSVADGFYGALTDRRFTGFRITRSELGLPRA
jgi:ribosomal protein S18 acetylase RimI-like enzyme